MAVPPAANIDAYVAALPKEAQPIAQAVRETIRKAAPAASEAIKYGMPAFVIGKRSIIYFAVWKKHLGLYPIYRGSPDFEQKIAAFRAKKDTVQFELNKPIPHDLMAEIVASQLSKAD